MDTLDNRDIVDLDTLIYWLKKHYEVYKADISLLPKEAYLTLRLKAKGDDDR